VDRVHIRTYTGFNLVVKDGNFPPPPPLPILKFKYFCNTELLSVVGRERERNFPLSKEAGKWRVTKLFFTLRIKVVLIYGGDRCEAGVILIL
jgi:hypothetical protein